jgi:tRNA-splicing ligase RtcB
MEVRMSERSLAPIRTWLAAPMNHDVSEAIERLRRAPDVQQIAVMPDVHLAADVCVGVVVATSHLIYPQAVGGDIGCGMLAVGFDVEATALKDPEMAGRVLAGLGRTVPDRRRNRRAAITPPSDLARSMLSHPSLEAMRRNEGVIEFATLGSGNHFIELQGDEDGRLRNLPAMLGDVQTKRSSRRSSEGAEADDLSLQVSLVAGARNRRYLQLWSGAA